MKTLYLGIVSCTLSVILLIIIIVKFNTNTVEEQTPTTIIKTVYIEVTPTNTIPKPPTPTVVPPTVVPTTIKPTTIPPIHHRVYVAPPTPTTTISTPTTVHTQVGNKEFNKYVAEWKEEHPNQTPSLMMLWDDKFNPTPTNVHTTIQIDPKIEEFNKYVTEWKEENPNRTPILSILWDEKYNPVPTRTPFITRPPPTLAYSIGTITKNYSAPNFNVHDIQIHFDTHTYSSNNITYPQDVCYAVKYRDRQGALTPMRLKFSLFNYGERDEYIQLYEMSSPGTFDDADKGSKEHILTKLKNNEDTRRYTCN